jgi:isocitrate/isopropylmalate dehydrogenase
MESVIRERRWLTGDLGGKASTTEMGDAVARAV